MSLRYASKTDPGRVRKNNEDACFASGKTGLFIVADGMGGANAGEIASKMALDVVSGHFAITRELVPSIALANEVIYDASRSSPQYQGMGTTIVACAVKKNIFHIAWVGDSRAYLIRGSALQQVTTDHSMVQEQVDKGMLTPKEAATASFRNILTRALGIGPKVEPGSIEIPAMDGDYVLLCSDGLHGMISDAAIQDTVLRLRVPEEACSSLIEQANAAGGKDNCTVVIIHYRSGSLWNKLIPFS